MSQFNTGAALEQAFPNATTQRVRTQAPNRIGVEESLAAPGLVAAPPVSQGAETAAQLLAALGLAASAVQGIGALAEQRRAREARASAEVEAQQRGAGGLHARERAPILDGEIAERKLTVPDGVSIADHVASIIEDETEGFPPAYAEAYRSVMGPQLTRAFVGQQERIKVEANAESLRLIGEAAIDADTAAGINEQVAIARKALPNLSDTDILASVALPALESAARSGDQVRFDAAIEALGGRFPAEQIKAKAALATQLGQQEQAANEAVRQSVYRMFNEDMPSEAILGRVDELRKSGAIDEDEAFQFNARVEARDAQTYRDAYKALIETEKQRYEGDIYAEAKSSMFSANTESGAPLIGDRTYTTSDGVEHTITRSQQIERATNEAMVEIQNSAASPEEAFAGQVEFLSRNNVGFDPWSRVMQAGYTALANDIGTDKPPPANLAAGYDIYKRLRAMNPRLATKLAGSGDAERFYEIAMLSEQYETPGDTAGALFNAMRAFARPDPFSTGATGQINGKALAKAIEENRQSGRWWWKETAKNETEISGEIETLSRFYMRVVGLGPEDAVKSASEKYKATHEIIDGWSVPTNNTNLPPDLGAISRQVAASYAAKYPSEGVTAKNIGLRPGETDGTWRLVDTVSEMPVDAWQTDGFFTNADLWRLGQQFKAQDQQAIIDKVVAENRRSQAGHMPATNETIRKAIERMDTRPNVELR